MRFITGKDGSLIYEGARGSIRVVESIRGEGAQFKKVAFTTDTCCGTRLDVGHDYVAFVSGKGSLVEVNWGNIADVTDYYSEDSDYPRSEQGIIARVEGLLEGTLPLDKAIPTFMRTSVSQLGTPPPLPCPDPPATAEP